MSAKQSNLSRYGFDYVVATTQASVNATMKAFLDGVQQPLITVYYYADESGNPTEATGDKLAALTALNPFDVPAGADPAKDPNLGELCEARFMFGIRARMGLPACPEPKDIPDILTLSGNSSIVTYTSMCSEFEVVQLTPGGGYTPTLKWYRQAQDPAKPWLFRSKVNLSLTKTPDSDFAKLPEAVQGQIKNLGSDAFGVQQLLVDMSNAGLQSIPTIDGVEAGTPLFTFLQSNFIGVYFSRLKASGEPVLGYGVVKHDAMVSTLPVTDLNIWSSPYLGSNGQPAPTVTPQEQDAATVNYLCAVNKKTLPPPAPFDWNWVDAEEQANFDGAIALNRNTFASWLQDQLDGYVKSNCYKPWVHTPLDGWSRPSYEYRLDPNQAPGVTNPPSGSTVLSYSYQSPEAYDQAGLGGNIAHLRMSSAFNLSVDFSDNKITVQQHLLVYMDILHLSSGSHANIVDKTIMDVYRVMVDEHGRLGLVQETPVVVDRSESPNVGAFLNFFNKVSDMGDAAAQWARGLTSQSFKDVPISIIQDFVFPGGNTFAFKDAAFSDNQDLIAHITYVDPVVTAAVQAAQAAKAAGVPIPATA